WARAYMASPNDGTDTLNLYDVSGLAHFELGTALRRIRRHGPLATDTGRLVSDLGRQLRTALGTGSRDPFGLGVGYNSGVDLTPHALGLALESRFYDQMTHSRRYLGFGLRQLDWAVGENAWGASFVTGDGDVFPHCLHHQVANLAGSLNGRGRILQGAVVDGPNAQDAFTGIGLMPGMRSCSYSGRTNYAQFDGHGVRFVDNVADWPSTEPADDYTAPTVLLFAELSRGRVP
ncbi:MAG TPA: glycoside hydrolase family 9 protein, partial [Chloroflexota bacterium]|nr:glycoside hydrolase family 9 protein [Chloroflexota bacterium]